jgi:ubiquinone/menaquinone biosynthesis C-methylase UbiE
LTSLHRLLHAVASKPAVYDLIQRSLGSGTVNRELNAKAGAFRTGSWLVDVGGGTGLSSDLDLEYRHYVCLDVDPVKLSGFRHKHPSGLAVQGDAVRLPILDRSVDLVICRAVSHHLDDSTLPGLFSEAARVLRPDGRFVFLDAVVAPQRWRSRLLWRYDRGSYPRTDELLRRMFESAFRVVSWTRFAVHHEYVVGVGEPRRTA